MTFTKEFQQHRHEVLFVALLVMCLAQPLAHGMVGGLILFDALLTIVLAGVVAAVFKRRQERLVAIALALPAVLARWAAYGLNEQASFVSNVLHRILVILFLAFAIFTILRGIFEEKNIRLDHFIGTICGYLLAGVVWGNGFVLADVADKSSFTIAPEVASQLTNEHVRSFYFNYFSLCTLTGVVFGDIVPLGPVAATLTWLEAGFGQFYIAVVVAQLVSMAFPRRN